MRLFGTLLSAVGLVAASCLVPDVELVDSLPGGAAGSSATAGHAVGGQAGASGEDAGGTSDSGGTLNSAGAASESAGAGGDGPIELDDSAISCAALSKTACSGESCCLSPLVTGCSGCAYPPGSVSSVSDFRLDKYEVTVGRFRAFVKAYQGPPQPSTAEHPFVPASGWQAMWNGSIALDKDELESNMLLRPCQSMTIRTYTADPEANEQKPINCLTWYEAFAFCAWDGGFLPTELEWQYAATAGAENRTYPWTGQNLDTEHAVYGACGNGVSNDCNQSSIVEVGSKPAGSGKWLQLDLTGSMWEWLLDQAGPDFPIQQPCDDCADLVSGGNRGIRGGSWFEDFSFMPAARRLNDPPESVWYNVGIRCARLPE